MVTAEHKHKDHKTNDGQHHYVYYHCTKSRGPGSCRQRFIREEVLETQLLNQMLQIPEWV